MATTTTQEKPEVFYPPARPEAILAMIEKVNGKYHIGYERPVKKS